MVYHKSIGVLNMKKAFTLAEVLITLGIIGVVAALTMPNLIANHKKLETSARLKQAYSIVGQALVRAQADYGDISTWGYGGIYGSASESLSPNDVIPNFVNTYFKPYVKVVDDYGFTSPSKIGYEGPFFPISKGKQPSASKASYLLSLENGTLLIINIGDACVKKDEEGTCTQREWRNIDFTVDVNGFKRPNTSGKDVFIMALDLTRNSFTMHNYGDGTREKYLRNCKTDIDSQICGYLIMMDGWEIKDDYPWL